MEHIENIMKTWIQLNVWVWRLKNRNFDFFFKTFFDMAGISWESSVLRLCYLSRLTSLDKQVRRRATGAMARRVLRPQAARVSIVKHIFCAPLPPQLRSGWLWLLWRWRWFWAGARRRVYFRLRQTRKEQRGAWQWLMSWQKLRRSALGGPTVFSPERWKWK